MQKPCVYLMIFIQMLGYSLQVIITPCRVENIVTQPHHGTSLSKRELVRIVQIPPVFTQNVMVGRCVNATSEVSGSISAGSYFVCKQRYSTVEVYVMDSTSQTALSQQTFNNSVYDILDNFRAGNFVKEFVVVESGCDFTFNLLPLLLQRHEMRNQQPRPVHEITTLHDFHFLKSPYHTSAPEQITVPQRHHAIQSLINTNSQFPQSKQPQAYPQSYPASSLVQQSPPTTYPATSQQQQEPSTYPATLQQQPSTSHPSGGNTNDYDARSGQDHSGPLHTVIQHNTPPSQLDTNSTSLQNYVPQRTTGSDTIIGGRAQFDNDSTGNSDNVGDTRTGQNNSGTHLHHHSPSTDSTDTDSSSIPHYIPPERSGDHIGGRSKSDQSTTGNGEYASSPLAATPGKQLYDVSDPIGMPLYIFSPKIDPLLTNIDSKFYAN